MLFDMRLRRAIRSQSISIKNLVHEIIAEARFYKSTQDSLSKFKYTQKNGLLNLNIGCGLDIRDNFINIDLNLDKNIDKNLLKKDNFLIYDLRSGKLPFANSSCKYVYSSHFFEHLDYTAGIALMEDVFRVLTTDGTFRIVLPDIKSSMNAYINNDIDYFNLITGPDLSNLINWMPDRHIDTIDFVDIINLSVYQRGEHKCIYDEKKIIKVLKSIGYSTVEVSSFIEGMDENSELRKKYSFYIESKK